MQRIRRGSAATATRAAGISRELARTRAAYIVDVHYRLHCRIGARAEVLEGRQEIRFRLTSAFDAQAIALDWRPESEREEIERILQSVRINGRRRTRCTLRHGHLYIPAHALEVGENRITVEWRAPIRPAGAALTRHRDDFDGALYVYSLFVPADASTVFPCFDQPDLKAVFSLALTVPAQWQAISNAPVVTSAIARGKRTVAFGETEPISTYAFAFAAGPFVALGPIRGDATRLWARQSQRRRAQEHAAEILRLNQAAVRYCARYFGWRFPFRKYDLVLIANFPYRGMEHAGATFLNEGSVLADNADAQARLQRAQLVFHETAHQWMGDLVTMRWFDDLWIKEGFANFIACKLAERVIGTAAARLAFHDAKLGAYETDRTPGATALNHPVADLTQAKAAYNTIVYAKAPAVLRMLEHELGAACFRRGVQALVKAHAYGTVDWRELIEALAQASQRPLGRWSRTWLLSPGAKALSDPFAGMAVHAYALPKPDLSGVARAMRSLARARDALRRHHLWEYLWMAVRDRVLDPQRFIALALARARAEGSALTVARISARLRTAVQRLLSPEERQSLVPAIESLAWSAYRSSGERELRLAWMRAVIELSHTAASRARLHAILARAHRDLSPADRLAIAATLVASGRASVRSAARSLMPQTGSKGRGAAVHCLEAAVPDASAKLRLLDRWLHAPSVPEHWIDAALPYFNHPAHAEITLRLLPQALDAAPMLLRTRKIFFVNRWLGAFIAGQSSADALETVKRFLSRDDLAPELRLKLLESSDALARDVAVYAHWHY